VFEKFQNRSGVVTFHCAEMLRISLTLQLLSTGVMRPPSIATAFAILMFLLYTIEFVALSYPALMMGCFSKVRATAFARRAETVTPFGFKEAYSLSNSVVAIARET